ncbi:MAG: MFS transporter [Flavitalea sp.]
MDQKELSSSQIAIMAVAAGICVANIYYNQPILKEIASSFNVTEAKVGVIAVLAQAGYGLGLFFLTPMGDKINRKKLILILQGFLVVALLGMSLISNLYALYASSLLIGLFAVSAQVILPMAASLSVTNKGKKVAMVFTGILVGILVARVFSGFISGILGWHYVYAISAVFVVIAAGLIYFSLPDVKPAFTGTYVQLLQSTLVQLKRFAVLRRTTLLGAVIFGIFSSFWTTLTFQLSGEPFNYGPEKIGLFGILAVGGALLAPVFGKLADNGNAARAQLVMVILILTGILFIKFLPGWIGSYLIAVLFIDIGVQAVQVTNIATIYGLDQSANSRINTVYMTTYFLGGAIGTFAGVQCWRIGGWELVTWQMIAWAVIALILVWMGFRRSRSVTIDP